MILGYPNKTTKAWQMPPARQKPRRGQKPQSLAAWLDIATWAVVSSAQARIKAEIEAHYAEAVKSHLERGSSESQAQVAALTDLGNPYAAARRFNREYLTEKDAGQIAECLNTSRSYFPGAMFLMLILALTVLATARSLFFPDTSPITLIFQLGAMVVAVLVMIKCNRSACALAGQKPTPAILCQIFLFRAISIFAWAVLIGSFINTNYSSARDRINEPGDAYFFWTDLILHVVGLATLLCLGAFIALKFLRLRRKLQSADSEELDLPPQNPTTA